ALPAAPPAPRAAAPRAATSPGDTPRPLPRGVSEAEVSRLYQQYVQAKSSVGESSDDRTYDRLVRTIEQQAPKIMAEHRAQGVEFQVVVKDNQVILRAKPKP
ncbi:MAG TPA: MXAN_5187 C-terminal domain-containing protein, partial [Kofleriaceae bacterium]|nr:MXAN_5187 C-terminal domain-containing protein [Kofleriaceae bacterium]